MTSRRHSVRFAAMGLAMSGLMALAACGGDDSGDDTSTTVAVETTVAGDDSPATESASTDDSPATESASTDDSVTTATGDEAGTDAQGSADADADATVDTSDIDALSVEECRDLYQRFVSVGFNPASDADPEDTGEVFEALEDAAPDELKADIGVMREAFEALTEATREFGDDFTNPEYLAALEALGSPAVEAASARLEVFFANCEDAFCD